MGTPEFAVYSLQAICERSRHEIVAVITQPDRAKGRGRKLIPSPVKVYALERNLTVLQPERLRRKDSVELLRGLDADVFVVAAYGQILSETVLNMPRYGCVNVHGSLLPKYRGAAPIQRAIMDGEDRTGITIMRMDKGIDTGDIIITKDTAIDVDEDFGQLRDRLAQIGADLLLEALDAIEHGKAQYTPQDDEHATYASMINNQDTQIDWRQPSRQIRDTIRALSPIPGAYTHYEDRFLKIFETKLPDAAYMTQTIDAEPGTVVSVEKDGFWVKTSDSVLKVTRLQPQGGKVMSAADYMRGRPIMEKGRFIHDDVAVL